MIKIVNPGIRRGTVRIPASKSDGQRAYLAAALAKGTSVITGWGESNDERAMREALRSLGAKIILAENGELHISGWEHYPEEVTISAGESGLGIRLLAFVCATQSGITHIQGEGSLVNRPMEVIANSLPEFGATCHTTDGFVPLQISGPLKGASVEVDGSLSSQFISGLLMALPLASEQSELRVKDLKSGPYVAMTLQTLKAFGIAVHYSDLSCFEIPGGQSYKQAVYQVDADWSSAGYWLVAAATGHQITVSGLRNDSLQADKALLHILENAGCVLTETDRGYVIEGSNRCAFEADATDCPDLFPAMVAFAAACEGMSVIKGANRLVHKESHRGLTLQSEFAKLGLRIDLEGDYMHIHGTGKLTGGEVVSHHDHRIAMCLAIAGLNADAPVTIHGAEAVAKSYPDFWEHLAQLSH